MAYVQRSDYSRVISNDDLRDLLEEANEFFQGKEEGTVLDEAGSMAEAKIKMILGSVYDMAQEFAKNATTLPDPREQNVLRCYLHISVYYLHYVINPRDIPELRQLSYENCTSELEKIRDGELVIEVPKFEGSGRLMQFTGHKKFISKPFTDPLVFDDKQILP